jgi:ABC-type multidrug transport system ATPase subunit
MYLLETEGLTYQFRKEETVLNNIQLQVPDGSIYGFLGPNGAGKTTTLKLVLGLLRKQKGRVSIFGKDLEFDRLSILQQTGSLIESPSLYLHLTARENLLLYQRIYQCNPKRISYVLELTGLSHTGNKRCSSFSLGMKQRLAIAIALLHNPRLLILDEPTNGLDPAGIIEMRELLRSINRNLGITVLISSHLLSEIEKLATHTGIINNGSLIFQGTFSQLMQQQQATCSLFYKTSDNLAAQTFLRQLNILVDMEQDTLILPLLPREEIARINRELMKEGIDLFQIHAPETSLEQTFMNLINQN